MIFLYLPTKTLSLNEMHLRKWKKSSSKSYPRCEVKIIDNNCHVGLNSLVPNIVQVRSALGSVSAEQRDPPSTREYCGCFKRVAAGHDRRAGQTVIQLIAQRFFQPRVALPCWTKALLCPSQRSRSNPQQTIL